MEVSTERDCAKSNVGQSLCLDSLYGIEIDSGHISSRKNFLSQFSFQVLIHTIFFNANDDERSVHFSLQGRIEQQVKLDFTVLLFGLFFNFLQCFKIDRLGS